MASQTQRALANRAIAVAGFMEEWTAKIQKELIWGEKKDVRLKADTIMMMLQIMPQLAAEIRRLEGNLRKERIKGRGPL